jgi:hypothetical protein
LMSEGRYHQAQVCMNGHVVTAYYDSQSEHRRKFCEVCGAETITDCPSCESPIPGRWAAAGGFYTSPYHPPAHCGACGAAFPWTEARLAAARELSQDLKRLTPVEQAQLAATLPDLVHDVPMTPVSAGRFKRLVAKAGAGAADAFHDILVDVASETAKKAIWG